MSSPPLHSERSAFQTCSVCYPVSSQADIAGGILLKVIIVRCSICLFVYWLLMVCFSLYRPWRWRFWDARTAGLSILGKQQGESSARPARCLLSVLTSNLLTRFRWRVFIFSVSISVILLYFYSTLVQWHSASWQWGVAASSRTLCSSLCL